MGMFSRWLDGAAQRHFAKDEGGRTVFLPRGQRHLCYYIDAADESRLKSLVKIYAIAAALINLTGSMASLGFTQALTFDHGYARPEKMKFVLVVYLICSALFYIGPVLILWKVYRDALTALCAPLAVADSASLKFLPKDSGRLLLVVMLVAGILILLALGLFFLMLRRHP
jgi:hypothetical protein